MKSETFEGNKISWRDDDCIRANLTYLCSYLSKHSGNSRLQGVLTRNPKNRAYYKFADHGIDYFRIRSSDFGKKNTITRLRTSTVSGSTRDAGGGGWLRTKLIQFHTKPGPRVILGSYQSISRKYSNVIYIIIEGTQTIRLVKSRDL